jgi:hypothetical protein
MRNAKFAWGKPVSKASLGADTNCRDPEYPFSCLDDFDIHVTLPIQLTVARG